MQPTGRNRARSFGRRFERIGFIAFDDEMLERCSSFMRIAPAVDFQFDIMADGTLGDTFGLSLSFNGNLQATIAYQDYHDFREASAAFGEKRPPQYDDK